jgi:hypothetical protein
VTECQRRNSTNTTQKHKLPIFPSNPVASLTLVRGGILENGKNFVFLEDKTTLSRLNTDDTRGFKKHDDQNFDPTVFLEIAVFLEHRVS